MIKESKPQISYKSNENINIQNGFPSHQQERKKPQYKPTDFIIARNTKLNDQYVHESLSYTIVVYVYPLINSDNSP